MSCDRERAAAVEAEALRVFLLERVRGGADLRALLIGHAATLGRMTATCCADADSVRYTAEILKRTIDYNVIFGNAEVGHGKTEYH